MEEMQTFECALCGKQYKNLQDRINCETACLKEQNNLEKKRKLEEQRKEEERLDKAVTKIIEDYIRISKDIDKFYEKYGENVQLTHTHLKNRMDDEFSSVVFDLVNYFI